MLKFNRGLFIHSFRAKLFFSYLLAIMIPMVSALLFFGFHLYNQTKDSYENILHQFSNRADVTVNEFFSNISRNTFFYITNNTLTNIIEKPYVQSDLEFVEDHALLRKAMDQIVLMNGSIAGVTLLGFNGRYYSNSGANASNLEQFVQKLPQTELHKGKALMSAPYAEPGSSDKLVSIIRYLNDLEVNKKNRGYVKLDIKFQTIENMLGGLSDTNSDIGTIVVAGHDVIYLSKSKAADDQEITSFLHRLQQNSVQGNTPVQLTLDQEGFIYAATKIPSTEWVMVHYIPERVIKAVFQKNMVYYSLSSLLTLILAFILALVFSKYFFKPILRVKKAMKLVDAGALEHIVDDDNRKDELGQLVRSYNAMIRRLITSREREMNASQLQRRAELNMLQSQINPHFLYNTLNVVHSIAELRRVEEISVMVKSLASLYRYNLKSKDIVTIGSELEQTGNYVNIQKIRFVDKIKVSYSVDEELLSYPILKFLIQPVVENAFCHGLEKKEGPGTLTISIAKANQAVIMIRVEDDGVGMSEQAVHGLNARLEEWGAADDESGRTSVGLRNVISRIKTFYGPEYGLRVTSQMHAGTCVEIIIPAIREESS